MIEGIDTSHWEGEIDWQNVLKLGYKFSYHKATEGLHYIDPDYEKDIESAHSAGLLTGSYHFFRCAHDTLKQAQLFLKTIEGRPMVLPPVVDIEEDKIGYGWKNYQTAIKLFLDTVEKTTGRKPVIYTSKNYWNYTNNPAWAKDYPLWVAHYSTSITAPLLPVGWMNWTFWQYSEAGKNVVNPFDGVDLNHFNGSYDDLLKFCGQVTAPVIPELSDHDMVKLLWADHPLLHPKA
jgi:lysozyme